LYLSVIVSNLLLIDKIREKYVYRTVCPFFITDICVLLSDGLCGKQHKPALTFLD